MRRPLYGEKIFMSTWTRFIESVLDFASCFYPRAIKTDFGQTMTVKVRRARAFEENKEYILPVRLDDTEIPGIKPTIGYIHKKDVMINELVDLINKKVYGF